MGTFPDPVMLLSPEWTTGVLIAIGVTALVVVAFLLGLAYRRRRRAAAELSALSLNFAPEPGAAPVAGTGAASAGGGATAPGTSTADRDLDDSRALLAFAQELLGATTTPLVRTVLSRHLPPRLGARRVWISTHIRGRRRVFFDEVAERGARDVLTVSGQEWTTFPLRVDGGVIGLLGVESEGGLKPHVKEFIQLATPLVAQALNTVDHVESLREASLVDLLTGTATRREGLTRLGAEIKRSQRTGSAMAVLMLDLDRFKSINDRFGHAVGDAVLTEIGRTLRRTLRASDSRCRWGGEEFLVVLPDTDLNRAQVVANGLLRNIAAATVPGPRGPVGTTVSIGLTITRPGETHLESIVRRADIALYRAKEAGRGCVRVVLGDRDGNPIGHRRDDEANPPGKPPRAGTLPFPDRRNPLRRDRRSVPSPGRRSTDPRPDGSSQARDETAGVSDNWVRTSLR